MGYDELIKALGSVDDVEALFKTERPNKPGYPGSYYAHHSDATTTGYREPSNRRGQGYEAQPRSDKTVFMAPGDVDRISGIFQNTEMATRITPTFDKDGKPTGKAQLVLMEDYGPRKAGSVLAEVPYTTTPKVGLRPVEIGNPESPIGSSGKGVHWGSDITEVHPKPERLRNQSTTPVMPLSGRGSATGIGDNKLNPLALRNLYAKGGAVKMPDIYSAGSWKLI